MGDRIDKWREARLMATSIAAELETSAARFVLVTSPSARDGKSLFVDLLQREFQALGMTRFLLMDWPDLQHYRPGVSDDTIVLVDGPPLVQGEGILQIPAEWLGAFDGALLVVNKRRTRRDDLQQSVAWLRATGISPLGIIWNEHGLPPLADAIRRWQSRYERRAEERRQRADALKRASAADPSGRRRQTQPGMPVHLTAPRRPPGVQPVDVAGTQAGHTLGPDDILESAALASPSGWADADELDPLARAVARPVVEQPTPPSRPPAPQSDDAAKADSPTAPDDSAAGPSAGPTTARQVAAAPPVAPRPSRGRVRGDS